MEPEKIRKENTELAVAETNEITESNQVAESSEIVETEQVAEVDIREENKNDNVQNDISGKKPEEDTVSFDENATLVKETVISSNENTTDILLRNPRVEKILALETEIRRQNEQEKLRSKRIHQEQEYINQMMSSSVEELLGETKEEQKYNEELEQRIRGQVYRMHGLSDDKIEGMQEYHNAWYQGAAFSLFFLSAILFVLCGVLHGVCAEISLFMAFFTAIGGALLTNLKNQSGILGFLVKALYMLLFPAMMTVFICYELAFPIYGDLLFALTIAGTVVLLLGVLSYFIYDPYSEDRKKRKKAERYLRKMEKTAIKEVQKQEKAFDRQERKRKKQEKRTEKKLQQN